MKPTNKLLTNTTNRLPLLPLPIHYPTHQESCSHQSKKLFTSNSSKQWISLAQREELLERLITQAKSEQLMMLQLLQSMCRIQGGETKMTKKLQRRCNKDILDKTKCTYPGCNRSYSSEPTLQRHIKLKHNIVKEQPPQLYHDLHPQPNLTTQFESHDSKILQGYSSKEGQQLE